MAYNMGYTLTVNSASSGSYGQAASTRTFNGEIQSCVMIPSSSPLTAGCSGLFILRRGNSTISDILCRSSSATSAQKAYYPATAVQLTSGLATSNLTGSVCLAADSLNLIRVGGSSDGFNLGLSVKVIIKGDNAYP